MPFKPVSIRGTRREIGAALGKLARPIMDAYFDQSPTWKALRPWRGHAYLDALAQAAQLRVPAVWQELEGLAEGLRMAPADVLLWHCRGDLLHKTTDGCTSIAWRDAEGVRWIAHNEDGDPWLYGRCHVVDVQPDDAPGFLSFYYPGSLPGHTFGANRAGLVQTINNLRTRQRHAGVPRMLLARAVLDCATLPDALALLRDAPRAGGFHHLLGSAHDQRLYGVEATPAACSVAEIGRGYVHANHMVHGGAARQPQIITESSRARQSQAERLMDGWGGNASGADLIALLHDTDGALPILRRAADDPDGENTLATACFRMDGGQVELAIYDRQSEPVQRLTLPAGP
ncbi:peptidase C45 [Bordetella genomosp. 1]|uniref:Peptidase C45 n=1 Tax=Bordetella genomosp. 1 TaxID=1395607 RepID=A0A261SFR1_9BORD|nr:C45 family peptidase [Bordetella genomosp. 1]MDQ8032762.1 C45 family peptidase [Bordetella sp.]OZI35847.1 peptidase C45 [Bordetella genomosp. 1]OZI58514.1 peptidase C45 [Bordetella genomosp. 1]